MALTSFCDRNMAWCSRRWSEGCWISTKWIWREVILTSNAISWRWNCNSRQIYFMLKYHIQNKHWFYYTSFEVVQASITLQHNTLHFFCLYRPPPNRRNNLTDSMFTEQLPDLLDYVNSLPGLVYLVGDMNIHFVYPIQSLTKQTLTSLSLHSIAHVINGPTHMCGHIIDWVIVRPDDDIHKKSTVTDSLESDHYCTKS